MVKDPECVIPVRAARATTNADKEESISVSPAGARQVMEETTTTIPGTVVGPICALDVWKVLESTYLRPVFSLKHQEFKALLDVTIPDNTHPAKALDAIQLHIQQLSALDAIQLHIQWLSVLGLKMSDELISLIHTTCLPASYDIITLLMAFAYNKNKRQEFPAPAKLCKKIIAIYKQRQQKGKGKAKEMGDHTAKISNMQRKLVDPKFASQQQQCPQGQQQQQASGLQKANKKVKCGSKGRKDKKKDGLKNTVHLTSATMVKETPMVVDSPSILDIRKVPGADIPVTGKLLKPHDAHMGATINHACHLQVPASGQHLRALNDLHCRTQTSNGSSSWKHTCSLSPASSAPSWAATPFCAPMPEDKWVEHPAPHSLSPMPHLSLASCISGIAGTLLEQCLDAIYNTDSEDSDEEPLAKRLQHQHHKDHKATHPFYVATDDVELNGPSGPEGFVPSSGTGGMVAGAPALGEEHINDGSLTPFDEDMDSEARPGGAILVDDTVDNYYFMEYVSPSDSLHANFTDSAPFPDNLDIAGCVSLCKVDSVCNNITCKHNTDFASCRSCKENTKKHGLNLAKVSWSTKWMADSGASKHFSRNKTILQNIKKLKTKDRFIISTADGTQVTIEEYGSAVVFW
jgi:hypothetical protein